MTNKITVGNGTTYLGRNGNGKVKGLSALKMNFGGVEMIEISPINSKGNIAQCYIQFPVNDLQAVIKMLQEAE